MPRAVDPPGRYVTADYDPASRDLLFDPLTLPKFDWCNFLKETLHNGITWMTDVISTFTCGKVNLQPLHEILDEMWTEFVTGLSRGTLVISLISRGLWIVNNGLGLEWQQVIDAWSRFSQTWFSLNWLHDPIGSVQAGFAALVTLICDLGRWLVQVIANLVNIRVPAFFALEQLQQVITDFVDDWRAINWLNLLQIAANLRAALSAILKLSAGVIDWGITVIRNIAGIDMRNLFSAFAFAQLREVFNTFTSTMQAINWLQLPAALRTAFGAVITFVKGVVDWGITVFGNFGLDLRSLFGAFMFPQLRERLTLFFDTLAGINWLQAGAVMTAIGAAVTVVKDIGNWLLAVLTAFFGDGINTIRSMFASVGAFIDNLIQYFMGNDAAAAWRAALDMLAGITGASPIQAIMAAWNQLRDLLGTNIGDLIFNQIQNFLGGANIGDFIKDALSGIMLPIGNLTGEQPNLLATHGHFPSQSTIAENPWWIWDSAVTATPDGSGSARIDADATLRALRSDRFAVAGGTEISAAISLRWQNLTYTGSAPMRLEVIDYSGGVERGMFTQAYVGSPAANSDWITIAGSWITPADVDAIRLRLVLADTALAGRIWWDNGVLKRSGGILQDWIAGLQTTIQGVIDQAQAMVQGALDFAHSIIDNLWAGLTGIPGQIGKTVNDLRLAANALTDKMAATIDNLWQGLTGLPGQVGKTIEDLRLAAKGLRDFAQGTLDTIWGAFTGGTGVGKTLAELSTAVTTRLTKLTNDVQSILDQLWAAFNGVAVQAGKTLADLLAAAQALRTNVESRLNASSSLNALNLINTINFARLPALNRTNVPDLGTAITALINEGTSGVMTRRSTANVSLNSNAGGQIVQAGFFDRLDATPANISGALATSRFTVTRAGLYRCDLCYKIQPTVSAIWAIAPVLFRNGAVFRVGGDGIAFNYLLVGISVRYIKASFEVPLAANDQVQAGYQASNSTGTISSVFTGEDSGTECYFTCSLVNQDVA